MPSKKLVSKGKKKSSPKRKASVDDITEFSPPKKTNLGVDLAKLDLDRSYVEEGDTEPPKQRPKRQPRWQHKGTTPLVDWSSLPKGWNDQEPDLDEDDADAQIQRCHERIADNIMPHIFEHRLQSWEAAKAHDESLSKGEPAGLGLQVYKRIEELKFMQSEISRKGDKYEQLPNLKAILKVYREGTLKAWPGLVTYWSDGKQLCQPRPFDWAECEAINRANEGTKGFFTEPFAGFEQQTVLAHRNYGQYPGTFNFRYNLALKIAGATHWWTELDFLYDTGATMMTIYEGDITNIAGRQRTNRVFQARIVGSSNFVGFGGRRTCDIMMLDVTLLDRSRRTMTPWARVPVAVLEGVYNPRTSLLRVDGPVIRQSLISCMVPTRPSNSLLITRNLKGLRHAPRPPAHKWRAPLMIPGGTDWASAASIRGYDIEGTIYSAPISIPLPRNGYFVPKKFRSDEHALLSSSPSSSDTD